MQQDHLYFGNPEYVQEGEGDPETGSPRRYGKVIGITQRGKLSPPSPDASISIWRDFAGDHKIDIAGLRRKDEVIRVITAASSGQSQTKVAWLGSIEGALHHERVVSTSDHPGAPSGVEDLFTTGAKTARVDSATLVPVGRGTARVLVLRAVFVSKGALGPDAIT
jgi:hypothetical protein